MPTSSTAAWELRRDAAIATSLHLAGVLNAAHNPSAEQLALGATLLQMSLAALTADGILLRAIERYAQPLTDGVVSYVAPSDTIDIEDGAVVNGTQGVDIPIRMLSTHRQYNAIGTKAVSGQPTEYYPEKQPDGSITVFLYPVPTVDWTTLTYPRVRKPRDTDSGSVSLDVPTKFTESVVLKLAAQFCRHYNRDSKAKALMEEYVDARNRAMNDETPRGPMSFTAEPLFWGR